jgi:PAS domain S-box-containing protein
MYLNPNDYIANCYALPMFIVGASITFLGLFILIREQHSRVGFSFLFMCLSIGLYLVATGANYLSRDASLSLFWIRISQLGAVFIPTTILLFTENHLSPVHRYRFTAVTSIVLSMLFAIGVLFTDLHVKGSSQFFWGRFVQYGPLGFVYTGFFFCIMVFILRLYWLAYRKSSSEQQKKRMRGLFIAFSGGYLGAVDFLPVFGLPVYPFGYLPIGFFVVMSATVLMRYHFTDITPELAAKQILETMQGAVIVIDLKGKIQVTSRVAEDMLGYQKSELLDKDIKSILPSLSEVNTTPLLSGKSSSLEMTWYSRSGQRFEVSVSESTITNLSDNSPVGIVYAAYDITERKQAETALHASRAELQKEHEKLVQLFRKVEIAKREWEKTMDCIDDMVILTDMQGRVIRCNRSFQGFVNKPYDQLLGRDCIELLVERGIEVKEFFSKETEIFHKPAKRWFRVSAYPASGIDGEQVYGTVITIHDITDIKLMTQKLEQTNTEIEENRLSLRHALNELSALIRRVENEQAFNVRFANPDLRKCYELKKCSKADCPCYGKDAVRCWQVSGTHCGGAVQGAFALKIDNCVECEVYKTAASNPIFQIGEQFNNMMNILEHKNKELETAYSELKLSQAKILQQEKMASIGQLAAGVAHEINNPIGFVSSNLGTLDKYLSRLMEYTSVLAAVAGDLHDLAVDARLADERKRLKIDTIIDDARKLIAESRDGADRVKTIVQNLKSFSRVDQQQAIDADINECLETTLNIVWNELKYKATVSKDYGSLPRTWCYPQQLNQVFMNLLVNAAQAIEKQGTIMIRTWANANSLYASIADTGCGIAAANISRIFEPFFTTKEVGKGTGLGLSITYDIIKNHKGDITVESEVGKGTTFTVRIPACENNSSTLHQEEV